MTIATIIAGEYTKILLIPVIINCSITIKVKPIIIPPPFKLLGKYEIYIILLRWPQMLLWCVFLHNYQENDSLLVLSQHEKSLNIILSAPRM